MSSQEVVQDVNAIALSVEALSRQLDAFHAKHGVEVYEKLAAAWPPAPFISMQAVRQLYRHKRCVTEPA